MNRVKATIGAILAFGVPAAFGIVCVGLAWRFGHQHVHDVSADVVGGRAVLHTSDYYHSPGGIIAACGGLVVAWIAVTFLAVWAGGTMIAKRNGKW